MGPLSDISVVRIHTSTDPTSLAMPTRFFSVNSVISVAKRTF